MMNHAEKHILDMLRHFWYVKCYIPDELMCWSLSQLHNGNNPFTGKLGAHLKQDPRAQRGIDFEDNPLFEYSLKEIAKKERDKEPGLKIELTAEETETFLGFFKKPAEKLKLKRIVGTDPLAPSITVKLRLKRKRG